MKRTLLLTLPLLCGLALAAAPTSMTARALPGVQDEHDDEHGEHGERREESALHEGMNHLKRSLRTLRKSLKDEGRNAESLEVLVEAQRGVSSAKTEVPPLAAQQPEEQRAAFVNDYRRQLIGVERALLDIEEAVLDGDNARARELLKVAKNLEGPGHEKFTEDED